MVTSVPQSEALKPLFPTEHRRELLPVLLGCWRALPSCDVFLPPSPSSFSQSQSCVQSVKAEHLYTLFSNLIILRGHLMRVVIVLSEDLCQAVSHHYRKELLCQDWSSVLTASLQTVGPQRSSAMFPSSHLEILLFPGIWMRVAQTFGLKLIHDFLLFPPLVFLALISLLMFGPDLLYLKPFPIWKNVAFYGFVPSATPCVPWRSPSLAHARSVNPTLNGSHPSSSHESERLKMN